MESLCLSSNCVETAQFHCPCNSNIQFCSEECGRQHWAAVHQYEHCGIQFTPKSQKHTQVPNGILIGRYSRIRIVAYPLVDLTPDGAEFLKDKVRTAFGFESENTKNEAMCGTVSDEYFDEKLDDDKLTYIVLANVDTSIGEYPIGFALITTPKFGTAAIELELICSLSFERFIDKAALKDAVLERYPYVSRSDPRHQEYSEKRTNEIIAINNMKDRIRTGLGVVLICKMLDFFRTRGIKYVTLEAAEIRLVPYYARFAFTLADRYCGQQMPRELRRQIMEKMRSRNFSELVKFIQDNQKLFATKSRSIRMRLCDIDLGTKLACEWAEQYLKRGVPGEVWAQKLKMTKLFFPRAFTPSILHIEVRPFDDKLKYFVFNIPEDTSILYLEYGKRYTFKTVNPFPTHPFFISTDPIGGHRDLRGQVLNQVLTDGIMIIDTTELPLKTKLYGICDNHPNMGFEIQLRNVPRGLLRKK